MIRWSLSGLILFLAGSLSAADLEAGAAKTEITPTVGMPMWGYSVRKDRVVEAVLDPLHARALVLKVGEKKIALVSLDLGRPPTRNSMERIRKALEPDKFNELFLVASHTHHGPVVELDDWPKGGKSYVRGLEDLIVGVIRKADAARQPARFGVTQRETTLNRNRQSKRMDKPVDRTLLVLRVEDMAGKPIAHCVNFAAHPTMLPVDLFKFSADYPGAMAKHVETATGFPCLFLQGAAGDLSTNPPEGVKGPDAFGIRLGEEVLKSLEGLAITPLKGETTTRQEEFKFRCQLEVGNPLIRGALERAFFPEIIGFFEREYRDGVRPMLTTAMLGDNLGFVGVSGEFFCDHAIGLRRRARLPQLFFLGYCNDYQQYFPTIQAVAETGYGTGLPVSVAEFGAGERMMDRALIYLFQMRGMIPEEAKR
jgi:neutral ceramidase